MNINLSMNQNDILLIKVHHYDGKQISGSVTDMYSNVCRRFDNMTQLLYLIEQIINAGYTEPAEKTDIFESAQKENRFDLVPSEKSWIVTKQRVIATFKLRICFRKYNTWQGILSCSDTGTSGPFRSVVELVMMMDSELESVRKAFFGEAEQCR